MGIMLTFMFVVNMLAAIIVMPALARWLLVPKYKAAQAALGKNDGLPSH